MLDLFISITVFGGYEGGLRVVLEESYIRVSNFRIKYIREITKLCETYGILLNFSCFAKQKHTHNFFIVLRNCRSSKISLRIVSRNRNIKILFLITFFFLGAGSRTRDCFTAVRHADLSAMLRIISRNRKHTGEWEISFFYKKVFRKTLGKYLNGQLFRQISKIAIWTIISPNF